MARPRFRKPGPLGPPKARRRFLQGQNGRLDPGRSWPWNRQQAAQWASLQGVCPTHASRVRLIGLVNRITGAHRGARESALAELEVACALMRAGFDVEILAETQEKSADLRCGLGTARMYVEVTALTGSFCAPPPPPVRARMRKLGAAEDQASQHVLLSRLVARLSRKAAQLAHYAAPVVVAASVPHRDPENRLRHADWEIDLKHVAAGVTQLLARLPLLSAVLLTLWDVTPLPARANVRLANVHIVERSRHQAAAPRVRMLILNPLATHPLTEPEHARLRGLL